MFISLRINNVDQLPNGGPLTYSARDRGFEIGRENSDWSLPDPDKFISSRHCEIVFDRAQFWLRDVSRNGTFVNGSNQRLTAPHWLKQDDRIRIGRYIVDVSIGDGRTEAAVPPPAPQVASASSDGDLLRAIAAGAGIAPEILLHRPAQEIGAEIGAVLRIVVEELSVLLKARAAAKVLVKSSDRTMIAATDNNPLKFVPSADEVLEILLARRRSGYLDARASVKDAFADLKTHEIATYAAMQAALGRVLDDLAPDTIDRKVPASSFGSKKARNWDVMVATWRAREEAHENGILDVFLAYFSEAYAKASKPKA